VITELLSIDLGSR